MPLVPKLAPSQVSPGTWPALNSYLCVSFKQNSGERFRASWASCIIINLDLTRFVMMYLPNFLLRNFTKALWWNEHAWSFSYNSFVKLSDSLSGTFLNGTQLQCYKGTALSLIWPFIQNGTLETSKIYFQSPIYLSIILCKVAKSVKNWISSSCGY